MPFSSMLSDTVTILKQSGDKIEAVKASVQQNRIFINRTDILIEPDDLIQRKMSNGGIETYQVIDPVFYEGNFGIPGHYEIDTRKLGIPEAKALVQTITYNISGNNARINQNSVDNSSNVVNQVSPEVTVLLKDLRAALHKSSDNSFNIEEKLVVVDEIEQQFLTGKPNKTIISALVAALPTVESITNIATNIIGFLPK